MSEDLNNSLFGNFFYKPAVKWSAKYRIFHTGEDALSNRFTGIVEYLNETKYWLKEGKQHREDGPAMEYSSGMRYWFLEGKEYKQINLNDYIILDSYKGKYNLTWYKLLDKDNVFECPDIPGLITK